MMKKEEFRWLSIADAVEKGQKKSKVRRSECFLSLSYSNKKLKDNKEVKFIQWNIPAVETCPFRTEMCGGVDKNGKNCKCYAKKAENMYTSVRNRRKICLELSKDDEFVEIMSKQIEFELARTKKKIFFRIHESGDFYNYEYLEKWHKITEKFVGNDRIVFMAYTKSLPYFDKLYQKYGKNNVNIKVLSSIWADTKKEMVELTRKLGLEVYTADEDVEKFVEKNKNFEVCDCSDCGKCRKCYESNISLVVKIH